MARPVPADLEDALAANRAARDRFWAMPPEQKDAWVAWVERGRMPGTRRRRIGEAVRRLGSTAQARRTTVAAEQNGAVVLPRDDWWTWVLGLFLLAALEAFLVWLTVYRHHHSSKSPAAVVVSSKSTVPKVLGIRYQAAQFQLQQEKLGSTLVRRAAKRPKGIVVGQAPQAGKSVPQGTKVKLVVSNGPPGVAMPDVTGLAAADAVRALQARGLKPKLQQIASSQAPGTVVGQSPAAGKRAKRGTAVTLQVAKGRAAVAVPDVTGQTRQQAVAALQQAGLKTTVAQVPTSSQAPGTVVAQNPAAGQKVAQGSSVRLNIAKGQPQQTASTPTTTQTQTHTQTQTQPTTTSTGAAPTHGNDYTGLRLSQAVQKIVQGRQQVIVQYVTSSKPAGVVVANSTAGSRERLQVSAGPHPKPGASVPDVTGEDASTAQSDLQAAGFSVLVAQWPVSDPTSDGNVVFETPAGGQQVPQGSTIVIYVGSSS